MMYIYGVYNVQRKWIPRKIENFPRDVVGIPYKVDIEKSKKSVARELTEEEMEKYSKSILDEYLRIYNIKV